MAKLEELTRGSVVQGILREGLVTVVDARWHGSNVVELTYKDSAGKLASELLYREEELIARAISPLGNARAAPAE